MAALTDYTTYDDIRAVLGVGSDELSDGTLALKVYEIGLRLALEDVDSSIPSLFASTKAVGTPTAKQTAFLDAVTYFATYRVAKEVSTSLPTFAFKEVTDGKASDTRFNDAYKVTLERIDLALGQALGALTQAFSSLQSVTLTSTTLNMFGVASGSTDPVTNS